MLHAADTYDGLVAAFEWRIPPQYNIGIDACDKWANGSGRLALICETRDGQATRYTFDELKSLSDRFANALRKSGVKKGERVGIFLAQSVETALAHLAVYKCGAIAVPLFALFGPDALQYRLSDSGAVALVTDLGGAQKIASVRASLPELRSIFCVDTDHADAALQVESFWSALNESPAAFDAEPTLADDPAVIIYTSGTTGKPKGALHAHRVLLGHLPGVEMPQAFFPNDARLMWTPADWAWIGGLFDVLLPSWHHGVAVLARRFEKFDGEAAFDLMQRHAVTHTFLPPTALKMMRTVEHPERWTLSLRAVASGGESLGAELIEWGRRALGVTINEFYGQTECNVVVSSCSTLFEPCFGSIGKVVPGHRVAIVDDTGHTVPRGEPGNIAIHAPDPVMFLGYWRNESATRDKFRGDWLLTGDMGLMDADGFIRFVGRDDDVITSAGYRIGPAPIEDCLLRHPAVRMAAVVGAPDAQRTEIVTAFVVLNPGYQASDALVQTLQEHVKTHLAAHEYPRAIHFVDALPMTATGKVIRRELRERVTPPR
ncbi:acetyl-CoA synthetase [Paraburkholderia sp. PGU19]|uniref:acyl-CoA synthetase n=1 Tax=Paraburkholderia sp. PGU19 TaxID=2735434 RepID=UPI0015DB5E03|nr:acyl-CoA synthetase [Paraburkholderia sp. PGU19]BCF97621.1 acetyl-CoA synthetase [Paraburkholderia sp. PGU19]